VKININEEGAELANKDKPVVKELGLLDDFDTIFSFKHWIKDNLDLYRDNEGSGDGRKEVPYEDLLVYLEYIEVKIRENKEIDRSEWAKKGGELVSKCKSIIRLQNEEE